MGSTKFVLLIKYLDCVYKLNGSSSNPETLKSQQSLSHSYGCGCCFTYLIFVLSWKMIIVLVGRYYFLHGNVYVLTAVAILVYFKRLHHFYGECMAFV